MTTNRRAGHAGLVLFTLGLVLAACSGAAAPSPTPSASPSGSPSTAPSDGADTGSGSLPPDSPIVGEPPGGGAGDPGSGGQPTLVVPKPGTIDPHPVAVNQLLAQVDGRHVVVNARWWSGVEPCYVLDSVNVQRSGNTFTVTLLEGSTDRDAMCIEIAMEKAAVIDLGELDPGTYIVQASHGDAAAITVVVE